MFRLKKGRDPGQGSRPISKSQVYSWQYSIQISWLQPGSRQQRSYFRSKMSPTEVWHWPPVVSQGK